MPLSFDRQDVLAAESAGAPRYDAIAGLLADAIAAGTLVVGERLPTVRSLAARLGVSGATVAAAYDALARRGLTRGEVGRGTFVAAGPAQHAPARPPFAAAAAVTASPWRRRAIASSMSLLRRAHPQAVDCASGLPDARLLPMEVLRRSWRRVADDLSPDALQYASVDPLPALADALVPRLETRGVPARPSDLVVGSSALQLIHLSLDVVGRRLGGAGVAVVEEPGYPTVLDLVERMGWALAGADVDEQGMRPDALERALAAGAAAVVVTPRGHNPTGASWTPQRHADLCDVIAGHPHVVVVEDDHAAMVATGDGPASLASDARLRDRVVHIRSFSKAVAPDLRIAVAAAPPPLRALLSEAKSYADGWTSRLLQTVLAHVLADPELPAALAGACAAYGVRREAAIAGLLEGGLAAAGGGVMPAADGMNLWVTLPPAVGESEVLERAAAAGVIAGAGEPYHVRPGRVGALRFTVASLAEAEARRAGMALAEAAAGVVEDRLQSPAV